MTNKRPGRAAFTLAGLIFATAIGLALAGIWTGDGRWGTTAVLATIAAVVALMTGAAQAAAAEKHQQPTPGRGIPDTTFQARPMTAIPRPPHNGQRTSTILSPDEFNRLMGDDDKDD